MTVKQRNQPSNRGDQPVTFRHSDAQRIANAVAAHEGGRRDRKPSQLPRAAGGGGGGSELRTATFLGGWLRGTYRVINFDGHNVAFGSTNTAVCLNITNHIYGVGSSTAARRCFVTLAPTTVGDYLLVSAQH